MRAYCSRAGRADLADRRGHPVVSGTAGRQQDDRMGTLRVPRHGAQAHRELGLGRLESRRPQSGEGPLRREPHLELELRESQVFQFVQA
jgi:hypothetical protein